MITLKKECDTLRESKAQLEKEASVNLDSAAAAKKEAVSVVHPMFSCACVTEIF